MSKEQEKKLAKFRGRLLTIHDLADIGQVHKRTVQRFSKRGIIPPPAFAFGNFVRWKASAVKAWLNRKSPITNRSNRSK